MGLTLDMAFVFFISRLYVLFRTSSYTWFIKKNLKFFNIFLIILEAGFFWGLHTIHHSSEYYNLSTALRQAAIQDAGLVFYDILQVSTIFHNKK